MRGRPVGRADNNVRRKPAGGRPEQGNRRRNNSAPYRDSRGGEQYREPRRDTGRRPETREDYRRPTSSGGGYDRDTRRSDFENPATRDNRRPPALMDLPRIERRDVPDDLRAPRDNYRDDYQARSYPDSRPVSRPIDMLPKSRDSGGKGTMSNRTPVMSRLSPKKRSNEKRLGSPLREDDLRKRLRRNFRDRSPLTSSGREYPDEHGDRKDRPEYRGPEENIDFNRDELRKLQIRITKPLLGQAARGYDELPARRPVTPDPPIIYPRDGDRGRARQDSYSKAPVRDQQRKSWDNDIALHRMKNEGLRHIESDNRKPFRRDDIHRDPLPERRMPEPSRDRAPAGGDRTRGRDRRDRPVSDDRGRYDNPPPQPRESDRRERDRMLRDAPRYSEAAPRRGRSSERSRNPPAYSQYGREAPQPLFDYPVRRPLAY